MMSFHKDKLLQVSELVKGSDVDAWMIIGHETATNSEPTLSVISESEMIGMTAIIFNRDNTSTVICTPIDADGYRLGDTFTEVTVFKNSFSETLYEYCKAKKVMTVALNYSEQDPASDGIASGVFDIVAPVFESLGITVSSASDMNRKLRGQKTPRELALIKTTALETNRLIKEIGSQMKVNMTCANVVDMFQEATDRLGYGYSWSKLHNPGVATKGSPIGHAKSGDITLQMNACVNIDFGIRINKYGSDLQRMFYISDATNSVPNEVLEAFNTVKQAIKKGKTFLKPGVTGRQVDSVVRQYIIDSGYASYHCATGHEVGMFAHDGGMLLAQDRPGVDRTKLIDTPIQEGQVFTIEPYVVTQYGRIGIEEMVVVTHDSSEFIVQPQASIYIIKGE